MVIRGTTAEERRQARSERTRQNRHTFFLTAMATAVTGRQRLQAACAYVKAVADNLDDPGRTGFAREVAELAERWNRA